MTDQPARLTPAQIAELQRQRVGRYCITISCSHYLDPLLAAASRDAAPDPRDELIERLRDAVLMILPLVRQDGKYGVALREAVESAIAAGYGRDKTEGE